MQAFPVPRRTSLGCAIALVLCAATPALAADPPVPVPAPAAPPPAATAPALPTAAPPAPAMTASAPSTTAPAPGPVNALPPLAAPVPPPGPAAPGPYVGWVVPVPGDHSLEQYQKRKRLIIAGASIFGLAYYGALTAGSIGVSRNNRGSKEWAAALFPFAGPFVAAGLRATPNPPQEADFAGTGLMIGLGVTQLLGTGLFFLGITSAHGRDRDPCAEYRRSGSAPCRPSLKPQVSVQPIVTPSFAGAGVTGSF